MLTKATQGKARNRARDHEEKNPANTRKVTQDTANIDSTLQYDIKVTDKPHNTVYAYTGCLFYLTTMSCYTL
jgi:hypothetical protein